MSSALEQALAAEATARGGKDDAAAALSQREAELAAAEAAMASASAAVKKASTDLQARESEWLNRRDAALHTAHGELGKAPAKDKHQADGHHAHGGHGHDHDDVLHGAQHQLQHRWVEKTAFGISERVVHHMAENVGERIAERAAEEALEGAGRHMLARAIGETLRMGEHTAMQALKALSVLVPFVGMFFVFHLAEHDYGRMIEEFGKKRSLTTALFALAVTGDILDILAHAFVVSAGLIHIDHHFLHTIEHYGMASAVVACLSVMAGEILSARQTRQEGKKKAAVHVVPVNDESLAMGA